MYFVNAPPTYPVHALTAGCSGQALTALRFDDSGMHLAVGTNNGRVALFDLRSQVRAGHAGCIA